MRAGPDSRPLRSVRDGLLHYVRARLWLSVAVALVLVGGMTAAAVLTFGGRESGAASNSTPQVVGSATTFDSASSATATTTLPTGTASGDVVVSVIDTSPIVAVTCPQGSSQEFDTVTASTTFVACMNVVSGSPTSATANLQPAGPVSMVTMAFSGVNDSEPVQVAKSGGGVLSPATITKTTDELLVLGEGSGGSEVVPNVPAGATPGATVNDAATAQAAMATIAVPTETSWQGSWSSVPARTAVSGVLALVPAGASPATTPTTAPTSSATAAPSVPPVEVCGNSTILNGPSTAPSGAVTLSPSNFTEGFATNTTYWFSPGVYDMATTQLDPATGDDLVGAPGAILNGEDGTSEAAFTGSATGVTLSYLTIENFSGGGEGQGAVNSDVASNWTISHDTVEDTEYGAGVSVGSNDILEYDCLTKNGEYGFNAYTASGVSNVTVEYDEISFNDTDNYDQPGGTQCGCAGGAKFWETDGATVEYNYIHDNLEVGLWVDSDNTGFDISNNYIANNQSEGIVYEISYNALISDNTLIGNGIGACTMTTPQAGCDDFPMPAIYISESGGDSRVGGDYSGSLTVTGNVLIDNWSGVIVYQDGGRYCGDLATGESDGLCTLVDPSQVYYSPGGGGLPNVSWNSGSTTIDGNFPAGIVGDAIFSGTAGIPSTATITGETAGTSVTISAATTSGPVTGARANWTSCSSTNLAGSGPGQTPIDYYDDCQWKAQNVLVENNTFDFNPTIVGPACVNENPVSGPAESFECGFNGLFASWSNVNPWGSQSPYGGYTVQYYITDTQNNVFKENTYNGPWQFDEGNQSSDSSWAKWTAGFKDPVSNVVYPAQDSGSSYDASKLN